MREKISEIFKDKINKIIISNPAGGEYRKIQFRLLDNKFQIEKFTQKQAFHSYCEISEAERCVFKIMEDGFRQLDAWGEDKQYTIRVSKKGKVTLITQKARENTQKITEHNRQKQYILKENTDIPPLVDLGVFTKDGKVVRTMYDKFRQINRFTELIRDGMEELGKDSIKILDFGCGKSYLTFILYYYLVMIRKMDTEIIGLDLKADVIEKCSALAEKYGYDKLKFQVGDINGYKSDMTPDMVISLHACDTATDYALFNGVQWNCKLIYSVPCCQHQLNGQIKKDNLPILSRYGILKERFSALSTDAIRGALLEACGYKVQVLEFVDMAHSPKNLLIRAVKKNIPEGKRIEAQKEAEELMNMFGFVPELYTMLKEKGFLPRK